ncbi:MAG TPA: hypothetical protein VEF36_16230, partial [Roseiarcus sp.]|nr:hypothetical protein [Roseiarcus sp.]
RVPPGPPAANRVYRYRSKLTRIAQTKSVQELTVGFWDTAHKGDFGQMKVGAEYEYIQRQILAGLPGTGGAPKADENVFMTSLRYYPF